MIYLIINGRFISNSLPDVLKSSDLFIRLNVQTILQFYKTYESPSQSKNRFIKLAE